MDYIEIIINAYQNYAQYLWHEITHPHWKNYFYWLIGVSLIFFMIELAQPWRKDQPKFRKDFWLDFFYMFFNFFLFSLIFFNAASEVVVDLFNRFLGLFGVNNLVAFHIESTPRWVQWIILFLVADFVQFWTHRLLHRVPWLWEFHKVHHSVEQMGFAAHLRYHWMENIVYKMIQYIPLAMIGFGIDDFFIVHIVALTVGHFNHSNFKLPLGPLKYILNNPQMHIWHHAAEWPDKFKYGVNFGLTLSVWDYIFKTDYIPNDGRDIKLGFDNLEAFPKTFWKQIIYGFSKK